MAGGPALAVAPAVGLSVLSSRCRLGRPVKKGPVKKGPVKKGPVKKGPVRKGPVKKGPVKKGQVKKGPVRKAAGQGRAEMLARPRLNRSREQAE